MNRAGHLLLVRVVLASNLIYLMIAIDLPKWVIKAIDKKHQGFLWKGQEKVKGGTSRLLGEGPAASRVWWLGIHNLETLIWALRIHWLSAQKTDPSRTWAGLPVQVAHNAQALFYVVFKSIVGNGKTIRFWSDCWLSGKTVAEIAPNLIKLIPKRVVKNRTVAQALENRT